MITEHDFFAHTLSYLLRNSYQKDIAYTNTTNWYPDTYPHYRLNFYNRIQVSQVLGIYVAFNPDFLKQFSTIIEIGTYNGGFTSWLADNKREDALIVSYDIDASINHSNRKDIDFRVEDCFANTTIIDIINLINRDGKTLMLCDGGNKPKEFDEFSKYLKKGDVIMAHDYCADKDIWNDVTKFWHWPYAHETLYEQIKDTIDRENLIPYKNNEFNFFLWASYTKN
jgi:hypothetical protein